MSDEHEIIKRARSATREEGPLRDFISLVFVLGVTPLVISAYASFCGWAWRLIP